VNWGEEEEEREKRVQILWSFGCSRLGNIGQRGKKKTKGKKRKVGN
jgi:hypothetical protein